MDIKLFALCRNFTRRSWKKEKIYRNGIKLNPHRFLIIIYDFFFFFSFLYYYLSSSSSPCYFLSSLQSWTNINKYCWFSYDLFAILSHKKLYGEDQPMIEIEWKSFLLSIPFPSFSIPNRTQWTLAPKTRNTINNEDRNSLFQLFPYNLWSIEVRSLIHFWYFWKSVNY